jgi:hypothetical protein
LGSVVKTKNKKQKKEKERKKEGRKEKEKEKASFKHILGRRSYRKRTFDEACNKIWRKHRSAPQDFARSAKNLPGSTRNLLYPFAAEPMLTRALSTVPLRPATARSH